jgi:hypothetical protein
MASALTSTETRTARLQIYRQTLELNQVEQHKETLCSTQTLPEVDIINVTFPPGGMTTLAQCLEQNQTLSTFKLTVDSGYNDWTEAEKEPTQDKLVEKRGNEEDLRTLGDAIAKHPTLVHLGTQGLRLNDLEMRAFASVFSSAHLQSVDLSKALADPSTSLQQIADAIGSCNLQFFYLEQQPATSET